MNLSEKYLWKIFSRKPRRGEAQGCVKQHPSVRRYGLSILAAVLTAHGGMAMAAEESVSEATAATTGLMGEWCKVKKRRVTQYTVKEGELHIRSGRSGQLFEADLSCNNDHTVCEAKTIRGWGTPVTEILRLDGEQMNLTRVWGGAWKDKTYNFTFTRCPKW